MNQRSADLRRFFFLGFLKLLGDGLWDTAGFAVRAAGSISFGATERRLIT